MGQTVEARMSKAEGFTYATSKLDAAAMLSASSLSDMVGAYSLGFIGTAYTAAHEAMNSDAELPALLLGRCGSFSGPPTPCSDKPFLHHYSGQPPHRLSLSAGPPAITTASPYREIVPLSFSSEDHIWRYTAVEAAPIHISSSAWV